jgi:putative tryptophan/tyrosine transport system substrate-binding protein
MSMMRREFITLLGGAVAAGTGSLVARAQQPVPAIGFMSSRSTEDSVHLVEGFRRGLAEHGLVEGQSVAIEYRWAQGQYERLRPIADELVKRNVAVLVAMGGAASALAAKEATSSIPIVFSVGPDPVKLGLVSSFNRPGSNVTGVSLFTSNLETKRLGLLHELVPKATRIGALVNPRNPPSADQTRDIQEAARSINIHLQILNASSPQELETAFASVLQQRTDALLVGADPFFDTQRDRIVGFAAQHRLPALYQFREYATGGGLASYGISLVDAYRQVGDYAARIIRGTKPGVLPVTQPTKFELIINLKAAKALDLAVPPTLLARTDEVIE